MLCDYDVVNVLPLNERVRNVVTLDGFVRHPGEYELSAGLRLSQLVTADRVLPEADLTHAELRHVDPTTFAVRVEAFSVRDLWAGKGDVPLQPLDAVSVFSSLRVPRSVVLEGEVVRPGTYAIAAGDRLSDVLRRAGGVTSQGWLPAAVFTRKTAGEQEQRTLQDFQQRQQVELAHDQAVLAQSADSSASRDVAAAQNQLLDAVSRQSSTGRLVVDLDAAGHWMATSRDPVLEDGDKLSVPVRPTAVTVIGSVMNPGTIMARRGGSFGDYVRLAGGTSRQADLHRSYVIRANGAAVARSRAGTIEPGDAIVVAPRGPSNGNLGRTLDAGWKFLAELAATLAVVAAVRK